MLGNDLGLKTIQHLGLTGSCCQGQPIQHQPHIEPVGEGRALLCSSQATTAAGAGMEPGRGRSAQGPARFPTSTVSRHFWGCLQGWEGSPGPPLPAWAGGPWRQHHHLEMLVQGSAQGYTRKGLGKGRSMERWAGDSEDRQGWGNRGRKTTPQGFSHPWSKVLLPRTGCKPSTCPLPPPPLPR